MTNRTWENRMFSLIPNTAWKKKYQLFEQEEKGGNFVAFVLHKCQNNTMWLQSQIIFFWDNSIQYDIFGMIGCCLVFMDIVLSADLTLADRTYIFPFVFCSFPQIITWIVLPFLFLFFSFLCASYFSCFRTEDLYIRFNRSGPFYMNTIRFSSKILGSFLIWILSCWRYGKRNYYIFLNSK